MTSIKPRYKSENTIVEFTDLHNPVSDDRYERFWKEVFHIALKGEQRPETLTDEEIKRVCQLALITVPRHISLATGLDDTLPTEAEPR